MPEEFDGDLAGAVFWGADLRGAHFRDVDLSGAVISHALLVDVEIDAFVDRIVVNGVDVTAYVNERDAWYPLRTMLRPSDAEGMRAAWDALGGEWATTVVRAQALPEAALHRQVDGEFSFVQTVRHLVFAIDKWFTVPVLGGEFDPIGLPNRGSVEFPWPGLDYERAPTVTDALAVWSARSMRLVEYLGSLSDADFDRPIVVLENGPNPLRACIDAVLEEVFWHIRYARRDLEALETQTSTS